MKLNSFFIITVFFLSFIAGGFSCKTNTSNARENVVYYYPEKNIYYDSLQSNYYYSLNGGKTWDSLAFTGPGYGMVLGPKIPIERSGDSVWMNNALHRKQYNGKLLNVINNHTILLSKADSISKIKTITVVKTQPEVVKKEEPPKRGLKKFFNKLFGKKKKPDEEIKQ